MERKKGSLTVEACIVFPVFLCFFFLLLLFLKIVYLQVVLGHATSEAAKEIAGKAYSLKIFEELEQELPVGIKEITGFLDISAAKAIIDKHLPDGFNKEAVRLSKVHFPHFNEDTAKADSEIAVNKEDVVLELEYDFNINLPFWGKGVNIIRTAAIERAWLYGGNSNYTRSAERGLDKINDSEIVYITRTGERYHRSNCRYLRMSKGPITIREAKKAGYTPCQICKPPP